MNNKTKKTIINSLYIIIYIAVYIILLNVMNINYHPDSRFSLDPIQIDLYSFFLVTILSILYPIFLNCDYENYHRFLLILFCMIITTQTIGNIIFYYLFPDNITLLIMIIFTLFTVVLIFVGFSLGFFIRKIFKK